MAQLIPYATLTIHSPLTVENFLLRLQEEIEEPSFFRLSGTHDYPFEGKVTGHSFKLRRLGWNSRKKPATILGTLKPMDSGGCEVEVELYITWQTYMLTTLPLVLFMLFLHHELYELQRILTYLLIYVVIALGWMIFEFNNDVTASKRLLENIH